MYFYNSAVELQNFLTIYVVRVPYFKGLHYAASFSKPGFSYTKLYCPNDLERN